MFTGIVTDVGKIAELEKTKDTQVKILCNFNVSEISIGASVCCDGVCLTVTDYGTTMNENWFTVDVSSETMLKTKIGHEKFGWYPGRKVNLERSLKVGDELGGHIVTVHIDSTASIEKILSVEGSTQVTFQIDKELSKFIAEKGSITLNGTSLTVNEVNDCCFDINFIPPTKNSTTWQEIHLGEKVNVEIDILARYVNKMLVLGK